MSANKDQIQPAIVVNIEESIAPLHVRHRGQPYARLVGYVVELPVAVVVVERVIFVLEIREVDRRTTLVKVVANRDPHRRLFSSVLADGRARFKADLAELSVTLRFCTGNSGSHHWPQKYPAAPCY